MSMDEFDPVGFSLNGEPAEQEDITVMEQLALGLLKPVPAELYRQYAYDKNGAIVSFLTMEHEEPQAETEDQEGNYQSIRFAHNEFSNIKFELSFDQSSEPGHLSFATDEDLAAAIKIAQDVLESDALTPTERNIVQHVQSLMLFFTGAVPLGEITPSLDGDKAYRLIGEVIETLVKEKTKHVIKVKDISIPLGEYGELGIITHEIPGLEISGEDVWVPALQIEFRDTEKRLSFCYSRSQFGVSSFDVTTLEELVDYGDHEYSEEDEEVDAMLDDLDASRPGKRDVAHLTEKLIEAALLDYAAQS